MDNLKWITRKEFEAYLRVKEFMRKDDYDEADLRTKIRGRRPSRSPQIILSDDMEPREYECLTDAANDIKVPRETLIYAYKNRRQLITRRKGGVKVFYFEWLSRLLSIRTDTRNLEKLKELLD